MKEAAGEANLTVVAIILIGVIVAVVTPLINSLMKSTANRTCCTDAGGVWKGNTCTEAAGSSDFDRTGYDECVKNSGKE
ncbi:MAG: hypothetical protein HFI87_02575 [Bacilli bacterium]|nr:hypothetical protein [Bacilli bacterium]